MNKYISSVDEQWNVMKRVGVGSGERELRGHTTVSLAL